MPYYEDCLEQVIQTHYQDDYSEDYVEEAQKRIRTDKQENAECRQYHAYDYRRNIRESLTLAEEEQYQFKCGDTEYHDSGRPRKKDCCLVGPDYKQNAEYQKNDTADYHVIAY